MSDYVEVTPGTGAQIAVDAIDGVKHQLVKVEFGADGAATQVSSGSPLPVTIGSGPFAITDNSGSLTVDDGGLTLSIDDGAGSLTVDGTVAVSSVSGSVAVTDNGGSLTIDDGAGSITVDGSVTATATGAAATDAAASGNPVLMAGRVSLADATAVSADGDVQVPWLTRRGAIHIAPLPVAATVASVSAVGDPTAAATLFASNTSRMHAVVTNDSPATLYLKLGTSATATDYSYMIPSYGIWEMPTGVTYRGAISGLWSAASGSARCTELTV